MPRHPEVSLACVFVLVAALAAGCDNGIQTEGAPVTTTHPSPVAAASTATIAATPSAAGGRANPPRVVFVPAPGSEADIQKTGLTITPVNGNPAPAPSPTEVYAQPETVGKSYMETMPAGQATPPPPKNNSAMPDPVVDYVRFVRTLEEDRQRHMLGRRAILEQQGADAPAEAKMASLLTARVQQARARLAKLRARTAPPDCQLLAQMYTDALVQDGGEADQDATLVTQALAAGKAGDTAMHDALQGQLRDPGRNQERQQRHDTAFGRADGAFVRLCQKYPTSPPDFASIRIGDKPF